MKVRPLLSALLGICLVVGPAAAQQMTAEQAREEGKALGNAKRQDGSLVPTTDAQASAVPGYTGTDQPQSTYFDDPDALVAAGTAQRSTNDAYRTATDQGHTRATFSNSEILATTSRATAVENDPQAYLQGQSIGSESGQCQPLPPGSGTNGYYEATCNQGTKVTEEPRSCSIRMVPHIVNTERWFYFGAPDSNEGNGFAKNSVMQAKVAQGICRAVAVSPVGRQMLAGAPLSGDYAQDDVRNALPRFQPPLIERNMALANRFTALAEEAGMTPAQLAIGWVLSRAPHVVPIPGTTSIAHLDEDLAAATMTFAPDLLAAVDGLFPANALEGPRYGAAMQALIETELLPGEEVS